jgi:BRCA1-associated protein
MPPYYYHLKFELYATPDPTAAASASQQASSSGKTPAADENIWVPLPGASIFDDLPSHPRNRQPIPSQKQRWGQWGPVDHDHGHGHNHHSEYYGAAAGTYAQAAAANTRVIDCGARRGRAHDLVDGPGGGGGGGGGGEGGYGTTGQVSTLRNSERSSPPPQSPQRDGIAPEKAVRDWRFGRVRVESFDLEQQQQQRQEGGEMAMAGKSEGGGVVATPAASLGPNLGGMGQATKARYVPLGTKNTEAGWGIVHLYREGDESSAMRELPEVVQDGPGEGNSKGQQDGDGSEEEGTILCIPAVPSYMSPSDFLGFVGEKWRGYVSHYRMVLTDGMSRYMVLMKFRDSRRAREWRKEFDGKPFDSVEVSYFCCSTTLRRMFRY